ncbi:MAG: ABC transporter permease [Atopobiaceae bacterium]|nr:ABC transporter permease [Atopobiaceae bacterium]
MLVKLAMRNVRRAGRDYAIYFITVTLGVALFYAFNAVRSQAVLFDALSADSVRMLGLLTTLIGLFSVVVACVLGFLVVYANRFLIRRRRREFGTYLLLGMDAGRVSCMLLCETFLVGAVSLVAGLALGVAVSQGLSFLTAALMGTTMTKYRFIVSTDALVLTAVSFAAIFAVSALVDVVYIRRCKLVTLLCAREANEAGVVVRVPVRVACFAVAVTLLGLAYWQLGINGMRQIDVRFWVATALMLAGTFAFFWSVAGFVIFVLTNSPGVYLRGIRMFTVRQIASKVNTAFVSMGVVCVMLFLALTTASVGMGLLELFAGNIEQITRYDASVLAYPDYFSSDDTWRETSARYDGSIAACLADRASAWDEAVRASGQVDYWLLDVRYQALLDQVPGVERLANPDALGAMGTSEVQAVSQSQYNACCALVGEPGIELADDEFAVDNTVVGYDELGRALVDKGVRLEVTGTTLVGCGTLLRTPLATTAIPDVSLLLVVPDKVVEDLRQAGGSAEPAYSYLNIMYRADRAEGDAALARVLREALPPAGGVTPDPTDVDGQYQRCAWPVSNVYTARAMADQAGGLRMVISFLALYIGFVMLVATAAVLAIQQLSEVTDSQGRYRRLRDLGCDQRQIYGSLRTQTVVYFCAPLVLAACHTICAVGVVGGTLFSELGVDPTGLIGVAAGAIVGVYAVYLVATYALSKSIV